MIVEHKTKELAKLFYKEIVRICESEMPNPEDKTDSIYQLINKIIIHVSQEEKVQFTTFFARLIFVFQKYKIEKKTQFYIHSFRKERFKRRKENSGKKEDNILKLGLIAIATLIKELFHTAPSDEVLKWIPEKVDYAYKKVEIKQKREKIRVVVLSDDVENQQLIAYEKEHPLEEIKIKYNLPDRNENFNPTIRVIRNIFHFPVVLNLIDVLIDKDGFYLPRAFVINPDYLIDVSAISECFKEFGTEPLLYLLKKFLPFQTTKHLMIGNIANFFLDELMHNPDITFKETFPKVFKLNPLAFALFDNSTIREIMQKSQKHFLNLKNYVLRDFQKFEIEPKDCYLEPSFYSEMYGIQGRLDAFYNSEKKSAIIELKSGQAYMPNRYGISNNHYTQTLLYDLIIRSVFGKEIEPVNYIFYSALDSRNLRYAPVVKSQQFEAIQIRNQILAIEKSIEKINEKGGWNIFLRIAMGRFPQIKGFLARDITLFEKVYNQLNPLERDYFNSFASFIAKEYQLAKIGVEGEDNQNGLASLWQDSLRDKENNFNILANLVIAENKADQEEPIIVFNRTDKTNPLANFRMGDIAILSPAEKDKVGVLNHQIFKSTIVKIDDQSIVVRLRSKQFNSFIFNDFQFWNLEHDMMDSGFLNMNRGLFEFAQCPASKRQLLLTQRAPIKPDKLNIEKRDNLTNEQQVILEKALSANEYFLLWGPPGTGKTSKMLKNLVAWILNYTSENLLLLAYTNRAVDEICEAISEIGEDIKDQFVRIGSVYSTSPKFKDQLLSEKTKKIKTRQELREIIDTRRIFVSTLASFSSKKDLVKIKKFHRVIIDEASQILEPALVGLLPNFEKFILIGDHKQLPAVVRQKEEESQVENPELIDLGLKNLRNSFFERLYKRCEAENWDWAYSKLSHQGRMHKEIMQFPSEHFYNGNLRILPEVIPHSEHQQKNLNFPQIGNAKINLGHRTVFIDTPVDINSQTLKTNIYEAQMVGKVVIELAKIYGSLNRQLTSKCLGVITPYRAQIAQIQDVIKELKIENFKFTIDTVERYQGGARDIILVSLCTNSLSQLNTLISLSDEGIDRKLNVALTRAREQIIILGNKQILLQNPIYAKLIEAFENEKDG